MEAEFTGMPDSNNVSKTEEIPAVQSSASSIYAETDFVKWSSYLIGCAGLMSSELENTIKIQLNKLITEYDINPDLAIKTSEKLAQDLASYFNDINNNNVYIEYLFSELNKRVNGDDKTWHDRLFAIKNDLSNVVDALDKLKRGEKIEANLKTLADINKQIDVYAEDLDNWISDTLDN